MTIDAIFKRYEVPDDVQCAALVRGAFVLELQKGWVGPDITWPVLVKALIFANLGTESGHIRKKAGLDKYVVTLIARGVPKFIRAVATAHDWHQKLYLYCAVESGLVFPNEEDHGVYRAMRHDVQTNLLHEVHIPKQTSVGQGNKLRGIEIYHYKNPSV